MHMPPPRPGNAGRQPLTPWLSDDPNPRTLGKTGCHRLGQPAPERRHTLKRSGSSPTRHAQVLQGETQQGRRPADPAGTTAAWKRRRLGRGCGPVGAERRAVREGGPGGRRGPLGKKAQCEAPKIFSQHNLSDRAPLGSRWVKLTFCPHASTGARLRWPRQRFKSDAPCRSPGTPSTLRPRRDQRQKLHPPPLF